MRARPPDPRARLLARTGNRRSRSLTAPSAPEKARPWWLEHLGLVLTASFFVLLAFRVLAISSFDTTTAKAVVQNGGTATLALGMALGSARLVAMAIVFVLVGYYALAAYDRELGPIGLHWLYLLIPAILLVPWWTVIAASILVGTGWLLGGRRSRAGILAPTSIVSSGVDRAVLWSACLTVLFVIASADSWLPAERIEVGDQAAFTGYVLGERDGRDLVTLDATGSHGVRAYPIDDVTRSYCEPQGGLFFDTLLTVFRADTYASCPD